jgi:ATP-dependent DNA ligase
MEPVPGHIRIPLTQDHATMEISGRAPGGPSRWSTSRTAEWEPLDPVLVCEVQYDHMSRRRFRHGTKFLRRRPEKKPEACTFNQVELFRT